MRYLLDTNIVSQTIKVQPHAAVMQWWQRQDQLALMVSAIVFQELRFGIEMLPVGRKRDRLEEWLEIRLRREFAGRVLPVTAEIADLSGRFIADSKKSSHSADASDTLIAATAKVHGLKVVTLNRKHFERLGVELVGSKVVFRFNARYTVVE